MSLLRFWLLHSSNYGPAQNHNKGLHHRRRRSSRSLRTGWTRNGRNVVLVFEITSNYSYVSTTSQHTGSTAKNPDVAPLYRFHNSRRPSCPPRRGTPLNASSSVLFHQVAGCSWEVRKRRDTWELYSTTIKQLQGPQLPSYMLLFSQGSLLLAFILWAACSPAPVARALMHSPL